MWQAAGPGCGCSALAGAGEGYLAIGTLRWDGAGGRADTGQARPGRGRSALAGARGRTLGRQHVPGVAILRVRGKGEATWPLGRPNRSRSA